MIRRAPENVTVSLVGIAKPIKYRKAGRSGLIRENVAARKLSAVTRVLFQLLKVETNLCDFIRVAFYKSEF